MVEAQVAYIKKRNQISVKERIMKNKLFTTVATLALSAALLLGTSACSANGGGKSNAAKLQTFETSKDFYAASAAFGASFLNAAPADSAEGMSATIVTARPKEFSDENVAEIKNTLVMFDSVVGGGITFNVEPCGEADGDFIDYGYKITVSFNSGAATLYYNETGVKTETDNDDDRKTKTETTLKGVLVSGENKYETFGKKEEESSLTEKEYKLKLIVKKSDKTYVKFTYSTESDKGENETEYECEIYENGKKIQETSIEIEKENGLAEIKFEFENNGTPDGVEYKIVKRAENKFDIRREQNGKKSFILAEKTDDGYKFTYSNGYFENVN